MNPNLNIRSKIELEKWARRVLIDAMLEGIPFTTLSKCMKIDAEKLSAFACFGARLEPDEFKRVCVHMGEPQSLELNKMHKRLEQLEDRPSYGR